MKSEAEGKIDRLSEVLKKLNDWDNPGIEFNLQEDSIVLENGMILFSRHPFGGEDFGDRGYRAEPFFRGTGNIKIQKAGFFPCNSSLYHFSVKDSFCLNLIIFNNGWRKEAGDSGDTSSGYLRADVLGHGTSAEVRLYPLFRIS